MAVLMKAFITTSDKLNSLSVVDGQLIFVYDTQKIYLDFNGLRLSYAEGNSNESSSFIILTTEEDRLALTSPVEGFYFIESTSKIWRYKDKWIPVSSDGNSSINMVDSIDALPEEGNANQLYVLDDAIYRWDTATKEYVVVSGQSQWITL